VTGPEEEAGIARAEELLERLERARARLDATKDADEAVDVLNELAEIAKQVEAEIARAKREAEGHAEP
jgi:poly(A) polymerase Pap1